MKNFNLGQIIIKIPFSYMWILKKSIGETRTILDLGCGDGSLMSLLSKGEPWQITGVDIFDKSVKKATKSGVYKKAIRGDLIRVMEKMINKRQKFDVVFCSQVIEHITKSKGEKLLKLVDNLSKKRIVMGTPRGFMEQPEIFLGDNPYQVHRSGWSEKEFKDKGYQVYGVGFKPVWSEEGIGRSRNKLIIAGSTIIGFLFAPIVYFMPKLAAGILCIKEIRSEK